MFRERYKTLIIFYKDYAQVMRNCVQLNCDMIGNCELTGYKNKHRCFLMKGWE